MKQHALNWLKYSSILLLLLFSCKKKQKGILDDFPGGKFESVLIMNQNGVHDTLITEMTGPYTLAGSYFFKRNPEYGSDNLSFRIISDFNFQALFIAQGNINATITNYEVRTEKLFMAFESGDTLNGSINLTRK